MLGASQYPRDEKLSNEQFLHTAEAVRQYFQSRDAFALPSDNLLWLFDSPEAPSELDGRIRDFLRSARQRDEASRPRDVIVYYIGHGFFDDQKSYFLALHSLRPDAPDSSYRFKSLQLAIKSEARHARKYPGRYSDRLNIDSQKERRPSHVTGRIHRQHRRRAARVSGLGGTGGRVAGTELRGCGHLLRPSAPAHVVLSRG